MANQNGRKYGFTALFPILAGGHAAKLRLYLRSMDRDPYGSPLSEVSIIHMARFVMIDRLAYQGLPAERDNLKWSYLLFLCDFDGERVDALTGELIARLPKQVTEIWQHCLGFPGIQSRDRVAAYFERCQVKTNLFLADRPQDTVEDILRALRYKREFAELIIRWQQRPALTPSELKQGMRILQQNIEDGDMPHPGSL